MSDELRDEYQFDYRQAKPNRFAARISKEGMILPPLPETSLADDANGSSSAPFTPPDALKPHLSVGLPNEPILLYEGQVELLSSSENASLDCRIQLSWLPSPKVAFELQNPPIKNIFGVPEVLSFRLADGTEVGPCTSTGSKSSFGSNGSFSSLSGLVESRMIRPGDGLVRFVQFLIPNFPKLLGRTIKYPDGSTRAARLHLLGGGWRITLDETENANEIEKSLKSSFGFGFTYVGRLEKEDGSLFNDTESSKVLTALAYYISFTSGRWTGPYLTSGFDATDKEVWSVWDGSRTEPFQKRLSWLDPRHAEQFENPFAGFLKLWFDENWQEVIYFAIHWYIEANSQAGSIEGSIVLTQAAFELLSSAVLVERQAWLSHEGYEKLTAADRIRLLFRWAGIPTAIPNELDELSRFVIAEKGKPPDSSSATTMIRNTIIHPTKKNRERFGKHSNDSRQEAWNLGLWNLELCLLRLFEYHGTYRNRVRQSGKGEVELVPWASRT